MNPVLSRADLLRWMIANDAADDRCALLLGFRCEAPEIERGASQPSDVPDSSGASSTSGRAADPSAPERTELHPVPFLRMVERRSMRAPSPSSIPGGADATADFPPDLPTGDPLPAPLLLPSRKAGPVLFRLLAVTVRGRLLDEPRIVERVARREALRRLPRRQDRRFPSTIEIVVDQSQRLVPIRRDQADVAHRIEKRIGKTACRSSVVRGDDPRHLRSDLDGIRFRLGTSVLILGDLGWLGPSTIVAEWTRFIEQRGHSRASIGVLCPLPRSRWGPKVVRELRREVWDRIDNRVGTSDSEDATDARRDELLAIVGPTARIDPVILRAARYLFGNGRFDIGTELDAWKRISGKVELGAMMTAEDRAGYCAAFRAASDAVDPQRFEDFLETLKRHRRADDPFILVVEAAAYRALLADRPDLRALVDRMLPPAELGAFCARYSHALTKIERSAGEAGRIATEAMNYVRVRLGFGIDDDPLWIEAFERAASAGLRLKRVPSPNPLTIFQAGEFLRVEPTGARGPSGGVPIGGFLSSTKTPIVTLHTRIGESLPRKIDNETWHASRPRDIATVSVVSDVAAAHFDCVSRRVDFPWATSLGRDRDGLFIDVGERPEILRFRWISADRVVTAADDRSPGWRVDPKYRPKFASDYGIDQFGAYAELRVGQASQKMRWIPPGEFMMGSPATEVGRWSEEPQHRVVIEHGFWLADTPCTRAMWRKVMGKNPSVFKTDDRPVENVSWDDCREFVEKLASLTGDRNLRLPRESEWEYACRAGTTTATYVGDLEIGGDLNAPLLDRVAWYGGNCDREFELANARQTNYKFDGKDYASRRGGTHPVGKLESNPWGLFDMLGNVWEWCGDLWEDDPREADPDDGGADAGRVVRGGSWSLPARSLRAANRVGVLPSSRHDGLGFRLARGRVSWRSQAAAEPLRSERGRKKK